MPLRGHEPLLIMTESQNPRGFRENIRIFVTWTGVNPCSHDDSIVLKKQTSNGT